jgi:RimJ/RimL family protein N-acetyltransferase
MPFPLHTQRLVLRRFTADDLDAIGAVFGDPEVMRYVGSRRAPWTSEEVGDALDRVEAHWREHGFGPLAVIEAAAGVVVGECGLQLLEEGPDIELAYTLARGVWGRGYATEAAAAALKWGFGVLDLARIVGVTYPENVASQRVLEKVGMRRLGLRHCYGADLVEYALGADEHGARSAEGAAEPA